jgi:hypothetical protein
MHDAALVRRQRVQDRFFPHLSYLPGQGHGASPQGFLTALPVILYVEHEPLALSTAPIQDKTAKILEIIDSLTVPANNQAGIRAVHHVECHLLRRFLTQPYRGLHAHGHHKLLKEQLEGGSITKALVSGAGYLWSNRNLVL